MEFRVLDESHALAFERYAALPLREAIRADALAWGGFGRALSTIGFWAVLWYRLSHALSRAGADWPARLIQLGGQVVFHCEISRKAIIGPSFVVAHPTGVFIGPHCRIGAGCTVGMGAFVGSNTHPDDPLDYPTVCDQVGIGPTAHVMGPVVIGDGCRIGPNAVVLRSVPADHVVMPAAARVVSRQRLVCLHRPCADAGVDEPTADHTERVAL